MTLALGASCVTEALAMRDLAKRLVESYAVSDGRRDVGLRILSLTARVLRLAHEIRNDLPWGRSAHVAPLHSALEALRGLLSLEARRAVPPEDRPIGELCAALVYHLGRMISFLAAVARTYSEV